jgi:hypothetical protein
MAAVKDRLHELLLSTATYNGIDFVEIASPDERTLRVHFLNTVPLKSKVSKPTISGGEVVRTVAVHPINDTADWSIDAEERPVLELHVDAPGDFSTYTLALTSTTTPPALDRFYDHVAFSFKAGCPSDLDCGPGPSACPVLSGVAPAIDYLAKDFLSFRKALSDFSAVRYPRYRERSEADLGVMVMEALCAVADDLSYAQDRVAAEATLDTATQRRSLVRQARLVDYEPAPATAARVMLQLDVVRGPVQAGLLVSAPAPGGGPIYFETGIGLNDAATYPADPAWNHGIQPYFWDDSVRCLTRGTTDMWVLGHGFNFAPSQALLIETQVETPVDPPIRQIIHLTPSAPGLLDHAVEEVDPLFGSVNVTHIRWGAADALTDDHDLTRNTVLAGNLVPATQGRQFQERFGIEPVTPGSLPAALAAVALAVTRYGPNGTPSQPVPQHLYTLRGGRLSWVLADALDAKPVPEILLTQLPTQPGEVLTPWPWVRWLLDADANEPAFTLDSANYRRIARNSDKSETAEYVDDAGDTIRFGDDVFGPIPQPGSLMHVRYRVADGAAGNVAADSITAIDPSAAMVITRVTNPFPARGGADPEPVDRVRQLAPQAFRASQFRAVRREDYEHAAERLSWVLTAGTTFRWTGSWLTVFTTADPRAREGLAPEERAELVSLLNRYRLAGYESYAPAPHYAALDLTITVCARPNAFRGDVLAGLIARLGSGRLPDGSPAFFFADQFTFGTPLERSRLEAAIQATQGVAGVVSIAYRRRGVNAVFVELPEPALTVGADEILRVDNDPSRPNMGSLRIYVEGGK